MSADYSANRAVPTGAARRPPRSQARPAVAGGADYHGISEPLLHPGDAGAVGDRMHADKPPFRTSSAPGMRSAFLLRCHRDAGPDARLFTRYFRGLREWNRVHVRVTPRAAAATAGSLSLPERVAWVVGIVCLVVWGALYADSAAGSRHELKRFAALQSAAGLRAPEPDLSLWDTERITAWRQSLTEHAPPPLAVLSIPKIRLKVAVLPGTDDFTLESRRRSHRRHGAAGTDGNSGIAGHRDGFFRGLKDIGPGDVIEVETLRGKEVYRVERTWVVHPEDVSVLDPTPTRSLTLVTCYPFYYVGPAPQRFIVRAVRVEAAAISPWSVRTFKMDMEFAGGFMTRVVVRMMLSAALVCVDGCVVSLAQTSTTTSETKKFQVIAVDGNQLVVKLPEGTRELTVPDDFRFTVDGKQLSVSELKPGMKGTATITTKTTVTPVTVTEVKNGTVMQNMGSSILVKTDAGMKMFSQGDMDKRGVKIMKDGKVADISDFHANDHLTATIITSHPPKVMTEKQVQATLARSGGSMASGAGAGAAAGAAPAEAAAPGESGRAVAGGGNDR